MTTIKRQSRSADRIAARRLDRSLPFGRRLVLVDVENIVGGGLTSEMQVMHARAQLERVGCVESGDHVVVASGPSGLLPVACGWPGARRVMRSGINGADEALLEVFGEDIGRRFDRVVLASGDGIFAEEVAAVAVRGVDLTVAAHERSLSARLRMAAPQVVLLTQRRSGSRTLALPQPLTGAPSRRVSPDEHAA